jgi:hypothetical protein
LTPEKCPTIAVIPIATVPQKHTLKTETPILEPPVFEDIAPNTIRKTIKNPPFL